MYKNNSKVIDGKGQLSSYWVYGQVHSSTKSCVNKKRVPVACAVDGGLQRHNTQLICSGAASIETVVVQKSKRSSLMKNVT